MTDIYSIEPITTLRVRFKPSKQVREAMRDFYKDKIEASKLSFYATAESTILQEDYDSARYLDDMRLADNVLKVMGRHAVRLSHNIDLQKRKHGVTDLVVIPYDNEYFNELVSAVHFVTSINNEGYPNYHLYARFAKKSLVEGINRQERALQQFRKSALDPETSPHFTVSKPTLTVYHRMRRVEES